MTDIRKCDSCQGGVNGIKKVCQLMERCDGYGGCKGLWEGVITFRRCHTPQEVGKMLERFVR